MLFQTVVTTRSVSLMPNWYAKPVYDMLRLNDGVFCLVIHRGVSVPLTRFYDSFHVLVCNQLSMLISLDIFIIQLKDILVSRFMSQFRHNLSGSS